jgi:hypothetical protein
MNEKITTKVPPYNTGKVLIGVMYQPPMRSELSRDMVRLQTALIKPQLRRSATVDKWADRTIYVLAAISFVAVFFFM